MPRTLPPSFVTEKNAQFSSQPWIVLLEVQVNDTESIYITNHHIPVVSNGDTYDPYPIEVEDIESVLNGNLQEINIRISNISRQLMTYVEASDGLIGKIVLYQLINLNNLDDTYTEKFEVQSASVSEASLSLSISYFFMADAQFPGAFFSRDNCHWEFGSTECGFDATDLGQYNAGVDTPCIKRLNGNFGCIFYGDREFANGNPRTHPERYGAFPSIPLISNRIFPV